MSRIGAMLASDIYLGPYNSYIIVAIAAMYFLIRNNLVRQLLLLTSSYVIYWMISGWFVILLFWISTVDYLLVYVMLTHPRFRRACLVLSILSNFSVLFYFKYFNFFVDQFRLLLSQFGFAADGPAISILVPVGISFIVFHGVSFSIDAYRGTIKQSPGFFQYLLYVSYFPKILSGPITRSTQFIPQLAGVRRIPLGKFVSGCELVLLGLFKKIVIASFFAKYWNELHAAKDGGALLVYTAGACYGLFLLADFSGYTDIARGISRMLGLELAENFDQPYGATSLSEFWRRWHMSLSFWLRDYLYFPLGGSKRGLPRTLINLLVTMLLCGLWHGAAWSFVVWGFAHGAVMGIERLLREGLPGLRIAGPLRLAVTSFILSATWILFASSDLRTASDFLGHMTEFRSPVSNQVALVCLASFVVGPLASYYRVYNRLFDQIERRNALALVANSVMIVAIILQLWRGVDVSEFVYFRF
jgi:alginate O-acetyltransferase complex protein AlgI